MKDLARFLVVLSIFVFGFSMQIVAMNHPFGKKPEKKDGELFVEGKLIFFSNIYIYTCNKINIIVLFFYIYFK